MATGIGIRLDSGAIVNRKTSSTMTFVFKQTGSDGPYSPIGYFENGGFSLWDGRAITYDRNNITVGAGQVVYGIPPEKGYSSRVGVTASIKYFTVSLGTAVNGTMSGGGTVWEDGTVDVVASPNAGCYLVSWSDGSLEGIGSTVPVTRTIHGDANVTISATFEKMYKITYTKNGGTGTAPSSVYVKPGESLTLATDKTPNGGVRFERANYEFDGWALSESGDRAYGSGETIVPTSDLKLYAHWVAKFTVSFVANGGTGAMADQLFTYGVTQALSENVFKRDGHVFRGWSTNKDATVASIANKADGSRLSETAGAKVTLYAIWRLPDTLVCRKNVAEGGSSVSSVGTLKVTNQNGVTVASSSSGDIRFEGAAGATYTVSCAMGTDSVVWEKKGVKVGEDYRDEYQFAKGATVDYFFEEKQLHEIVFETDTPGCTAVVTSPAKPDKDGKYVSDQTISFEAKPDAGHVLSSVNFFNGSGGAIGSINDPSGNRFSIARMPTSTLNVSLHFKPKAFKVNAFKAAPSANAFEDVYVRLKGTTEKVSEADYGSEVEFVAVLKAGYDFEGWYLGKDLDNRVGQYAVHTRTVTGNVDAVAKAKVKCRLRLKYDDNRPDKTPAVLSQSCGITSGGQSVVGRDFYVTLGQSFDYSVTLGKLHSGTSELWRFGGWTKVVNGSDTGEYYPLAQGGTVRPTAPVDAMLTVYSFVDKPKLTVNILDEDTGERIPPIGLNIVPTMAPKPAEERIEGTYDRVFVFDGVNELDFTMRESFAYNGGVYGLNGVYAGDVLVSNGRYVKFQLPADTTLVAKYAKGGSRTVTVAYGSSDYAAMGEISADGKTSAECERGGKVRISAAPFNGFRFCGWCTDPNDLEGSVAFTSASNTVTVYSDVTYYAWFMKDTHSVCEWEGSDRNKMMTWKSKVYVLPRPTNPTCVRVDTVGYDNLEISVKMFSSPNADATAIATLDNVESQNVRRLPVLRMEKFLQAEVKNDAEVDGIYVGTSPGGLAV